MTVYGRWLPLVDIRGSEVPDGGVLSIQRLQSASYQLQKAQRAHNLASWRTAAEAYDEFVEATQGSDVLIALGDVRRDSEQLDLACLAYSRRCEVRPEDGEAFARLGSAAHEAGDHALARRALRRAFELGRLEREPRAPGLVLSDAINPAALTLLRNTIGPLPEDGWAEVGLGVGPPLRLRRIERAAPLADRVATLSLLTFSEGDDGAEAVRHAASAGAAVSQGLHLTVVLSDGPASTTLRGAAAFDVLVIEAERGASRRALLNVGLGIARMKAADVVLRLDPAVREPAGILGAVFDALDDPMVGSGMVVAAAPPLPGVLYGPPTSGPVVVLRARLLEEFGGLDALYDDAEVAVLDLCMRANRAAFASVRAPALSKTTATAGPRGMDALILRARFPELEVAEAAFTDDSEATARRLETRLSSGRPSLLVDLSSLRAHHDGTARMSVALLQALDALDRFDLTVACSREAARFHHLDGFGAAGRLQDADASGQWTACLKLSQPLNEAELLRTWSSAPVAGFVMHDAIIANSEALGARGVRDLWRLALQHSELAGFVSGFAERQFGLRFPVEDGAQRFIMRNSTAAAEYGGREGDAATSRRGLLVVGNPFGHKNLDNAVRRLRARRPDLPLTVLGQMHSDAPGVRWLHSGRMSDAAVKALYAGAQAVVFPSFQEGFGMPLMDALAAGTPVLALDQPVFHEIKARSGLSKNVHLFSTTDALVEGVDGVLETGFRLADPTVGEHTWSDAATQLADAVECAISTYTPARLRRRLAAGAALRSPVRAA